MHAAVAANDGAMPGGERRPIAAASPRDAIRISREQRAPEPGLVDAIAEGATEDGS